MSDGLLALAAGLTNGMTARVQRNEDLDRQDRLDSMRAQEQSMRMRMMDGQLSDQERLRKEEAGARTAGQDVQDDDVQPAPAVNQAPVSTPDAYGTDTAIDSAPAPSAGSVATPGSIQPSGGAATTPGSSPVSNGSGLLRTNASGLGGSKNTPEARAERIAKYWEGIGRQDKADETRLNFAANQDKLDQAHRSVALRMGMDYVARGDRAGLADKFYGTYNDGNTAEYVPGAGTSGTYVFKREGQPIGKFDFKNDDELRQGLYDHYFPAQRMARTNRLQDEMALIKAREDARIAGIMAHGGGGAGGSGGSLPRSFGNGKVVPDAAHVYLMNMVKEPKNGTMSEAQIGMAQAALGDIITNNPNIDPAHAAQAAFLYSQDPVKAATPAFNPTTGQFDDVVTTGVGAKVAVRRGVASYDNLGSMTREQAVAQVPMIANTLSSKFGVPPDLITKAAFDPVARRDALNAIVKNVSSLPGFDQLTDDMQQQRMKTARENADKLLQPSLSWIRSYSKPPKAPQTPAQAADRQRERDAIDASYSDPMDFRQ